MASDIVLVIGGSGFLGQHIIKELQLYDSSVAEIRVLDLIPYKNNLGHKEIKPVKMFIGNIQEKNITEAFQNVNCVFHCAALVSYEYPPDEDALHKTNVEGTLNIVELCRKFNVANLIFTSTTEVTLIPYFRKIGGLTIVVNQTEAKLIPPKDYSQLLFPGYSASKLKAEEIIISADKSHLENGGKLRTVSLRPTLMYGEEDYSFVPSVIKVAEICNGNIWQIAGVGGKHQVTYVGNVAWAHILAKKTLQETPQKISGLPIFITDETPIIDVTKFCIGLMNEPKKKKTYNIALWRIPYIISFIIALFIEFWMKILYPSVIRKKLPISPRALVSFVGSILLYNRLRAAIHLLYEPKYTYEESYKKSQEFYIRLKEKNGVKIK